MDEKLKKKKKLKQKQKQRQKQKQSVIVNVNLGKSRDKSTRERQPKNQRVQLPPPVYKVYASPIHDLVPQMFNKEGRQTSQSSLAEQIQNYFQKQEQPKQGNVLGEAPTSLVNFQKEIREIETQTEKTGGPGRKKGSKNNPKTYAFPIDEANVIASQAIAQKSSGNLEGWGPGERIIIPGKFNPERTSLRVPQYDDEPRTANIITNPPPVNEDMGLVKLFTPKRQRKKKSSKPINQPKQLIIENEDEE